MNIAELWRKPVTYAAVGATQDRELLRHPPQGYRPIERVARIGHGIARFEFAWAEAFTWGIQRRSGFGVILAETPKAVSDGTYVPITFDDDGTPIAPSVADEAVFGPDGVEFLKPGDSAVLTLPLFRIPVRVVYIVDEPTRKGFAYGTLPGHPEDGEESWIIEHRDDDSVWITVRAFSRPANKLWWVVYPALRIVQELFTRRYLTALAAPMPEALKPAS
jgi:uncharacterized protein (UPF0548 family)